VSVADECTEPIAWSLGVYSIGMAYDKVKTLWWKLDKDDLAAQSEKCVAFLDSLLVE
jgi:hypothetical protein